MERIWKDLLRTITCNMYSIRKSILFPIRINIYLCESHQVRILLFIILYPLVNDGYKKNATYENTTHSQLKNVAIFLSACIYLKSKSVIKATSIFKQLCEFSRENPFHILRRYFLCAEVGILHCLTCISVRSIFSFFFVHGKYTSGKVEWKQTTSRTQGQ